MTERTKLLSYNINNSNEDESSDENDWSESSYSSYYSDSDSSVPEWDSSIDENTGEVSYIECHPFVTQNITENKKEKDKPFSRNQLRKSTRGKFLRLIRRRESKRQSKRNAKVSEQTDSHNTSKVKFLDFQEGEEREVILKINHKSNSRMDSLIESLLGISVSTLSDGVRLMVAGFSQDSNAKYEKNIKIGDWLKNINDMEVNYQNLNSVLQQIIHKPEAKIKLQRVAGVEVTKDPPINKLNNQSPFVRQLVSLNLEENKMVSKFLSSYPLGICYIDLEKITENNASNEDIIYCYPEYFGKNILCASKGVFITINDLLIKITKKTANISSFYYRETLCHLLYKIYETKVFLLLIPDYGTKIDFEFLSEEITKMLEFMYGSIDICFGKNDQFDYYNNFFGKFFIYVLTGQFMAFENFLLKFNNPVNGFANFEAILPAAHQINLPNEISIQIDDALTELEACDYREWNDEPLDCQRLFTMLGSAWYHSGYLLASHLINEDLIDIHGYCRLQGLLHLSKTEPIKSLVLWREVFPSSCKNMENPIYKYPNTRRYLLIVGSGKDLLTVLMEAGGCTEPPEENSPPDPFYVEEAQATLAHLQELGISELADRFLAMNPGSQVTIPTVSTKKKFDIINFNKAMIQKDVKKQEVTSILKRRISDQNSMYVSTYSLPDDSLYDGHSEDSESQGDVSERSEISDENYFDKRKGGSIEEGSDVDDKTDGSQMSSNSFDVSEMRQILLSEMEDVQPRQLTAGTENVLYHYLQFDKTEGILLAPPECRVESQTRDIVISNFYKCCTRIHAMFQHTIRFKNMSSQEMAKSLMNKSLIAIKEYGIRFDCVIDEKEGKKNKISYWVIGRLFFNPHVKELYVCYNESIPQNMVEIAFKINTGFIDTRS